MERIGRSRVALKPTGIFKFCPIRAHQAFSDTKQTLKFKTRRVSVKKTQIQLFSGHCAVEEAILFLTEVNLPTVGIAWNCKLHSSG